MLFEPYRMPDSLLYLDYLLEQKPLFARFLAISKRLEPSYNILPGCSEIFPLFQVELIFLAFFFF
jgi:hypothetical protein